VLELDRLLDASPEELESHHVGLLKARANRLVRIGRSTATPLTQMDETVHKANTKVLRNPFDSPAAVKSSNQLAAEVHSFRCRLGIEDGHEAADAKRWGQAAGEMLEKVRVGTAEGAVAAKRFGDQTFDRATEVFRAVDLDGDGIPVRPRAAAAAEQAGAAMEGAACRSHRSGRQPVPAQAPGRGRGRRVGRRPLGLLTREQSLYEPPTACPANRSATAVRPARRSACDLARPRGE
jgi:hypothetical protein